MSLRDYEEGRAISSQGYSFNALIMAAMRKADSRNGAVLRTYFEEVWNELRARYDAPGGRLPGDAP